MQKLGVQRIRSRGTGGVAPVRVGAGVPSWVTDEEALGRAAGIFRAAGDVGRLKLLGELLAGERSVGDLAQAVDAGLSTVSQQLRVLRAEDLVVTRREGKRVYYSLADQRVVEALDSVLRYSRRLP